MFNNNNNNSNNPNYLNHKQYNEELALAKALSLSAETFAKEQKKRKEEEMKKYDKYLKVLKEKELKEKQKREKEENDPRYLACKRIESFLKSMKWDQMFINRGVGAGLRNLGNSCFLNATLQCLAYTAPFAQILQTANHSPICQNQKFCELCRLETFIPSMLLNRTKIHSPNQLFRNLSKINDLLTPGCQEDAHEFLQSLLDKMEMAYDDSYFIANNKNKNFKKDPFNPIRKLFNGTTKTTVMCSKCRTVTSTEEPFSCVSLDVDSDVTLTESLSIFTHDELLRGDEKYYCDQCKRKVIARKQLTLAKLPPNLIFHFKRFKLEAYSPHQRELSMKKLCDHIEFPSEIDFNEILDLVINPSHQKEVSNDSVYELYGIVVHSGPKLGYGHYYAFVKSFDGQQWYRMNDMQVLPIQFEKVLKEQAYLLFYQRKTHNTLQNEINQIKVEMMMDKNGNKMNNNANSEEKQNSNNNNNNNSNEKPQYRWENKTSSPTQVKSIPTMLDEKMDVNFLNDTYFESSCGNDTSDVIALNDKQQNSRENSKNKQFIASKMDKKSGLKSESSSMSTTDSGSGDDRAKFVMVPPMTTRSDVSQLESDSNDDSNGNDVKDTVKLSQKVSNVFEEVYWPGNMDGDMHLID